MRKILFLAHRIPYPPDRGDKIRSWNLLRYLARLGPVDLACFADDKADAAHLPAMREALGGRLGAVHVEIRRTNALFGGLQALMTGRPVSLALFSSPALARFVEQRLSSGEIGTILAFSGQMGQFVPAERDARFVMDLGDVDSEKFARYGADRKGPMGWIYRREAVRLGRHERIVASRADVATFVSEAEAALFRRLTGLGNIEAVSNGIDLGYFAPDSDFSPLAPEEAGQGPLLLFTGQMDYEPNVDAVRWFVREVLPRVKRARFVIAGRAPVPAVRRLACERVQVTGAVDDMRRWLAAADVVVAPLRIARGIQNKVLEAMAMARPVVASAAAFEGIEAEPGRHLLVADDAKEMAAQVEGLLASPERAERLGEQARARMLEAYAWDARLKPLDRHVLPPFGVAA